MDKKKPLGTFKLGGLHFYILRDLSFLALLFASANFYWNQIPMVFVRWPRSLLPYWIPLAVGAAVLVFGLLRLRMSEKVYIDNELGQIVKERKLFGLTQLVKLMSIDSVASLALCGCDVSLSGSRKPVLIGYMINDKNKVVPIDNASLGEKLNLRDRMRELAQELDVPLVEGGHHQWPQAQAEGKKVSFSSQSDRILNLRSVLWVPGICLILGLCYSLGTLALFQLQH